LKGVDFDVSEGEMFGLLGPNGAGKTTLLSILACLSDASKGEAILAGQKLSLSNRSVRHLIGIGTQELAIYGELTARENIRFFGKLYGLRDPQLKAREEEILRRIGLLDRAEDRAGTFSGGMKRRLNLGVAIVHSPKILYLDEPTTGVDPQSRNHIFEFVKELNRDGMTVIYTSHYMEEVQSLCPRIAIVDHGKVISCDTLPGLLRMLEGRITLRLGNYSSADLEVIQAIPNLKLVENAAGSLQIDTADVAKSLIQIVRVLSQRNVELLELHTKEPTLEDVFLHLTDRTLRD
jgi:ABC-2 type transport system ATP-binding protein